MARRSQGKRKRRKSGKSGGRSKARRYRVADGYSGKCYFGACLAGDGKRAFIVESEKSALLGWLYDAAGVEAAVAEALTWDGVYYVKVWLNEGALEVGESIMYVLIGADIRPRCIDALQNLVGKIKNELVVEKEIYA